MRREYVTLADRDIGKNCLWAFGRTWLVGGFIGRVLPTDVGKRVYRTGPDLDVLQVESDDQRSRRLGRCPEEPVYAGAGIQLPAFAVAWAALLAQIDLDDVCFAANAVLVAHNETCIECHNADMRARCPKRLALKAVMTQKEAN